MDKEKLALLETIYSFVACWPTDISEAPLVHPDIKELFKKFAQEKLNNES